MTFVSLRERAQKALQSIITSTLATILVVASLGAALPLIAGGSVAADSLAAPTNLLPTSGAYVHDNNTEFYDSWNAVAGASGYEYRTATTLNDDGSIGPIIFSDNSIDAASYYNIGDSIVTLNQNGSPEGTYYWQVRAFDGNGQYSPWSDVSAVTLDTTEPTDIAVSPDAGSSVTGVVTWVATASDAHPDTIHVELSKNGLWIADSSIGGSYEGETQSALAYDTALLANGDYTITVTATDKAGNVSHESYNYVVDHDLLSGPQQLTPLDGSRSTSRDVVFAWTPLNARYGVDYYDMRFSLSDIHTADGELSGDDIATLSTDDNAPLINLPADGTYYWQVRAIDNHNNIGNWSSIWSITIDTDPASPVVPTDPVAPANPMPTEATPTVPALTAANLVSINKPSTASAVTVTAPQILATSTKPVNGKVKGAATVASSKTFMGLGWWWLPLVIVAGFVVALLGRRKHNQ